MAKNETTYYLEGIRDNKLEVLEEVYQQYLPETLKMVRSNHGSVEDAQDIFQEALVILYHKSRTADFELTVPFRVYLRSVCRNLWWRQLKKKHRTDITLDDKIGYVLKEDLEPLAEKTEKWILFQQKMAILTAECRKVLELFFNGVKLKDIAQEMGYTNKYVKWKKYKCKEKLIELIQSDDRYWELKE